MKAAIDEAKKWMSTNRRRLHGSWTSEDAAQIVMDAITEGATRRRRAPVANDAAIRKFARDVLEVKLRSKRERRIRKLTSDAENLKQSEYGNDALDRATDFNRVPASFLAETRGKNSGRRWSTLEAMIGPAHPEQGKTGHSINPPPVSAFNAQGVPSWFLKAAQPPKRLPRKKSFEITKRGKETFGEIFKIQASAVNQTMKRSSQHTDYLAACDANQRRVAALQKAEREFEESKIVSRRFCAGAQAVAAPPRPESNGDFLEILSGIMEELSPRTLELLDSVLPITSNRTAFRQAAYVYVELGHIPQPEVAKKLIGVNQGTISRYLKEARAKIKTVSEKLAAPARMMALKAA